MSTARPDHPRPVDDAVDQAWHAASSEVPGSRIDAVILEAARAEVNRDHRHSATAGGATAPRRRNWWTAWQPLAAAATVAGLAFVLLQTMPRDRDVAPPIAIEQAPPAEAESSMVDPSPAPSAPTPPPPAAENAGSPPTAASAESRDQQPVRRRAAAPASASAGIAAQAGQELGESQRAMKSAPFELAAEAWAARVEEFFVAGEKAAAAAELRAFRAAHADADRYLPEDLRDWAGTVE